MKHFAKFASLQIFLQMYFRCVTVCFNTTIEGMNCISIGVWNKMYICIIGVTRITLQPRARVAQ